MNPTSSSGGSASGAAPAASAASAQNAHHPVKHRQGGEAGADLFSSLLSLLASTSQPAADVSADGAAPATDDATAPELPKDNPLAGLLASLPGWTPASLKATDGSRGAAGNGGTATDLPALRTGSPDGATPLTAEARALLQPLEPGAARERGMELRPERSAATDKARQSMAAAATALGAEHRSPGRGHESAPGLTWVRAGGASDAAASALATSRPTVALDERFAGTAAPTWSAVARRETATDDDLRPAEPGGLRNASGAGHGDSASGIAATTGGSDTGDGSLGSDGGQSGPKAGDEARLDDGGQPLPGTPDETEVTHWGAGHVRHASLRVGGDGQDAIDIQLRMDGQEVQVGFATDDAQARELLREQAPQVLGELLERSGVALGGVSVGAQGQPGQNTGSGLPSRPDTSHRVGRADRADEAATPVAAAARPRADGSRPLDVFA